MKLKFYTDLKYIPNGEGMITLLEPFLKSITEDGKKPVTDRFYEYNMVGKELFEQVDSVEEADFLLFPMAYELLDNKDAINEMSELAGKYRKKLVLFFNSDSTESIDIKNTIVFRTSFYKSHKKQNEFSLPGWSEDYIKNHFSGKLQIRKKSNKPVVGYCGYIDRSKPELSFSGIKKYIKRRLLRIGPKGAFIARKLRGEAVRRLQKGKGIVSNFIIRSEFMGNTANKDIRNEFIDNIISSDYCVVTRGEGNFSYRLYEVMSCGRIPLFINTDSVLPYDHIINWRDYFVWVEEYELDRIEEKLLEFHSSISSERFIELQKKIRELYEEWISPVGFHKKLWHCIVDGIEESE